MSICFIDSSALVKGYRNEVGSKSLSTTMKDADQLLIARLTIVEVSSALVRRARESKIAAEFLQTASGLLDAEVAGLFDIVELDQQVIERAVGLSRKHVLRGADFIQLACGLLALSDLPAATEFLFVSADEELNAAAAAEGLQVQNPNLHA
jgi:predicted nucleic acid-binding protein